MHEKIEKLKVKREELKMWCECCGEKVDRWEIDIVEPEPIAFEAFTSPDGNFACPVCVTELVLTPMQTEKAETFRKKNEALREIFAPTPIH